LVFGICTHAEFVIVRLFPSRFHTSVDIFRVAKLPYLWSVPCVSPNWRPRSSGSWRDADTAPAYLACSSTSAWKSQNLAFAYLARNVPSLCIQMVKKSIVDCRICGQYLSYSLYSWVQRAREVLSVGAARRKTIVRNVRFSLQKYEVSATTLFCTRSTKILWLGEF
jgi:hypothetical protein